MNTHGIGARIKQLRKENYLSQTDLAKDINLSQSILSQMENSHVAVSVNVLLKISRRFKVDSEWLLHGEEVHILIKQEHGLIPMLNREMVAGYLEDPTDPEILKKLEKFKIPGFSKGDFRIFQVEGDSMVPTLSSGDQIVCSKMSLTDEIKEGTLIVVVTKQEALIKRVYRSIKANALLVKSDNESFKPYALKKEDIKETWQVEAKITRSFIDSSFALIRRLDTLEKDVEQAKLQMRDVLSEIENVR